MNQTKMSVETIIGTVQTPGLWADIAGRCPRCAKHISLSEVPPENFTGENEFICPHCEANLEVVEVADA